MVYRKGDNRRKTPTTKPQTRPVLPLCTRISIDFGSSGLPDPFGDRLGDAILAGRATLVIETAAEQENSETEGLLTSDVIESCLKELAHGNAKPSTVQTYTKCWSRFAEVFEELPSDRESVGNQQKWDTFVKERSGGDGRVLGLPEQAVVAFALG